MADTRLRKRSTRQSESDPAVADIEGPPKKRYKRRNSPVLDDKPSSRPKRHRGPGEIGSRTTPPKSAAARSGRGSKPIKEVDHPRKGNRLLVSLNIQENDLHVSRQVECGGKGVPQRLRGRGRLANQQRDQSVVSDAGSSNGAVMNGKALAFKNPNFSFSSVGTNKKRVWKNLKQMLAAEKSLGLGPNAPTYASIDAPPSFKPAKKYSDLSGLIAKYTDPLTSLYFSTSQEFQVVRTLSQEVVQGYLALRGKLLIT